MTSGRRLLPARLLIVTDRHQAAQPLTMVVEAAFAAGARWVWLRDKDLPVLERRALARVLAELARHHDATVTVGADVELAAEIGAGVQLSVGSDIAAARRALQSRALIGVSAHGFADLRDARDAGADYATLSPIFQSSSKPGYGPALGVSGLREASKIDLPVLALGGVTADCAGACIDAGAAGVAVMGPAMRDGGAEARMLAVMLACGDR